MVDEEIEPRTQTNATRIGRVIGVLGAVVWVLIPLLMVSMIFMKSSSSKPIEVAPVVVNAVEATGPVSRPVNILVQRAPAQTLFAPDWSGTVQAVSLEVGDQIVSGAALTRIAGIERRIAVTAQPFDGFISEFSAPEDILMLSGYLRASGFDVVESGDFDESLLAAIRDYAQQVGVVESEEVEAFDASWVIFAPTEGSIASIELVIGAPAPPAGAPIMTLAPKIESAALMRTTDPIPTDDLMNTSLLVPTEHADELESLMLMNGVELALTSDRTTVEVSSFSSFEGILAGTDRNVLVAATLVRSNVEGAWILPSAAIMVGQSGATCVLVMRDGVEHSIRVTSYTLMNGQALTVAPLGEDDSVLITPSTGSAECD